MIMSNIPTLKNLVRERRSARGWSQQELAQRAAIARASVSAIEMGRLVPSAAAALALAAALDCRVEDLFQLTTAPATGPDWAWDPGGTPARYWQAEVNGREWLYPLEPTYLGTLAHDGLYDGTSLLPRVETPPPTLVMACCDPAVGLLATEFSRASGIRLLPLMRSSRAALRLLKQGLVHVAGLHLGPSGTESNAIAVRDELGEGYRLVRVADWEEGVVTPADRKLSSLRAAVAIPPGLGRPRTGLWCTAMSRRSARLAARAAPHRARPSRCGRSRACRLGRRRRLLAAGWRRSIATVPPRSQRSLRRLLSGSLRA